MSYKDIIKIVPTLQATSLLKENAKIKKKPKLVKKGVQSIVGIELIKLQSGLV